MEPLTRRALRRARAATASRHASAGADAAASGLLVLVARADACAAQQVRVELAVLHGDVSYTRPSPPVHRRWNQALIARRRSAALAPSMAARPRRSARWRAVFEGVLPVVGSTPSIPSFLMSSHFLSICTGFYWVRPVVLRFDHLSKVVKGPFWGGLRGATERPNGAILCRHVEETWMNKQSHFEPKPTIRATSVFVYPIWDDNDWLWHVAPRAHPGQQEHRNKSHSVPICTGPTLRLPGGEACPSVPPPPTGGGGVGG